jgi:hypothetical protein
MSMKPIDLSEGWRFLRQDVPDGADYSQLSVHDHLWPTLSILKGESLKELVSEEGWVWLRQAFDMPANEECSTWWLEFEEPLQGKLWVNGKPINAPNKQRMNVTAEVTMGSNLVVVCLECPLYPDEEHTWRKVSCVPYPCE